MVTLLQLNRHIDDVHQNLEEERQVEVKDWFQIQVDKAKRLRSLAVLGQKLKGKEVFEPNSNANAALSISPAAQSASHARSLSGDSSRFVANTTSTPSAATTTADPSELVTRNHWQPRTFNDYCADPACAKRLTATTGAVHCRRCGRLFCEEHTMYQMKLSQSAQHEPVRGVWCRVCETCYKSREGYSDHRGA
ncbi:carboxypeptidase Y-deficient [Ascosphaera acerosa]|nr:carboxypeptidase Y-deficient [Ascosphaera acerosa]